MKIAIDARIINSSTGRYIERLINYLEEIDTKHQYFILVKEKDKNFYKPRKPNFKILIADFADYSFAEQLEFAKLLNTLKLDLVHFCMPQQPLLYRGRRVTTVHDLNLLRIKSNDDMNFVELKVKKMIFKQLLKRVVKISDHIITPSEYTKKDLINFSGHAKGKTTVTLEGADKADAEPKPIEALDGEKFILYVGRAEAYKNNRGIIKAHQILLKKFPDLKLVIAGKIDDLRTADIKWIEQNKYKNIEFLGFVSNEELAWLYKNCQAYVFASFMEGFGLPGLEAMSYEAPVVSSNVTSLPEVYQDAALYFDPNKIEQIADKIEQILTNDQLKKDLITKGKIVHSKYSWKKMADQTLDIYNSVLAQK